MKKFCNIILLTFFLLTSICAAKDAVVIPVQGTIDKGISAFIDRTIKEHSNKPETDLFILDINTPGGRVDAAINISDSVLKSPKPVIAFVNNQAISAGALIALSCEKIAMSSGATIGDVQPQPTTEKTVSYLKAKMKSLAQKHKRNQKLAIAMVDINEEIKDIVTKEQLLTLTTKEAIKHRFVDFNVNTIEELLKAINKPDLNIIYSEVTIAENIARFITNPIVSSMLLTLGFLGILFELKMPGWGISGTFGLGCLLLFFGGHMIAGLAGMSALTAFIVGIVLLTLEILVIPGFGIAGVLGILSIFLSIYLVFGDIRQTMYVLIPAVLVTLSTLLYILLTLQDSWFAKILSLKTEESKEDGFVSPQIDDVQEGMQGISLSILRPSGKGEINGKEYSVITDGAFIEKGSPIEVTKVKGNNVYVKQTK